MVIEHVVHERPLAKMQEKLDHEATEEDAAQQATTPGVEETDGEKTKKTSEKNEDESGETNGSREEVDDPVAQVNGHAKEAEEKKPETPPRQVKVKHKMLLHNNDNELLRVEQVRSLLLIPTGGIFYPCR